MPLVRRSWPRVAVAVSLFLVPACAYRTAIPVSDVAAPSRASAQDAAEQAGSKPAAGSQGLDKQQSVEVVYEKTELETLSFDGRHADDMSREAFRVRYRSPGDPIGLRVDVLKENLLSSTFEGFGIEVAATGLETWGQPDERVTPLLEYDAGLSVRYAWGHSLPFPDEDQIYLLEVPARAGIGMEFKGVRLTTGAQLLGTLGHFDGPFVGPIYGFQAGVYGRLEYRIENHVLVTLHAVGGAIETVALSVGVLF